MPWPLFTPGKDTVPIVQEAGWAPGPVWTGAENLAPTRIRSPDRPARSQSLYWLSYTAHWLKVIYILLTFKTVHEIQDNVSILSSTSRRALRLETKTSDQLRYSAFRRCPLSSQPKLHNIPEKRSPGEFLCLRLFILYIVTSNNVDRDSSVGITTHYGLDGPGIKSR